ncbi:unnamed protein product [Rhizopus microsporus]
MGELSEQEKLEKRRARRQQRILASAESRLNKITGSQSAFRSSPTPSPSNSSNSFQETNVNSLANHYPSAQDPRRQKYEERLTPPPPSPQPTTFASRVQQHRPEVQKRIEEEKARELNDHGFLGGRVPQILLATMLRRTNPQERMNQKSARLPANKYWNLLHFVAMVWLGVCAVCSQWSTYGASGVCDLIHQNETYDHNTVYYPVFWYFVTIQSLLHFARKVYQPEYKITDELTFSGIVSQLPEALQDPACFVQKYGVIINEIFRDLCIVVFVIGFISLMTSLVY